MGVPWFPSWLQANRIGASPSLKVSDLSNRQRQEWDEQMLQTVFNLVEITEIRQLSEVPDPDSAMPGLLVWSDTNSGRYTVKSGYNALQELHPTTNLDLAHPVWETI